MLARTDSRARALVLLLVISLLTTGIGARLIWWHVLDTGDLVAMARSQFENTQPILAARGEIVDRSRRPAGDDRRAAVGLRHCRRSSRSTTRAKAAELLATVLDLDRADVYAKLDQRAAVDLAAAPRSIRRMAARAHALHLAGIGMLPEPKRVYPVEGRLAGHHDGRPGHRLRQRRRRGPGGRGAAERRHRWPASRADDGRPGRRRPADRRLDCARSSRRSTAQT